LETAKCFGFFSFQECGRNGKQEREREKVFIIFIRGRALSTQAFMLSVRNRFESIALWEIESGRMFLFQMTKMCNNRADNPHTHTKEKKGKTKSEFSLGSCLPFDFESKARRCFVLFFGWKGETSCISVFSLEITSRVGLGEQVVRPVCVWCVVVLLKKKKKKKKTKEN
jgi:hypothetical protein